MSADATSLHAYDTASTELGSARFFRTDGTIVRSDSTWAEEVERTFLRSTGPFADARRVAGDMVKACRENGAAYFLVESEGDEIDHDGTDASIVDALLACGETTLEPYDRESVRLGYALFVPSSGEDAITDYSDNAWTRGVVDSFWQVD